DLCRRPPECLARDGARLAGASGEVAAEVLRDAAGEKKPAEHGPKRVWRDRGTGAAGDYLGNCVGLLRGKSALLDREAGDVAGCVDVVELLNAAVRVGRDEAVIVLRDAEYPQALEARECDGPLGLDGRRGNELEPARFVAG